MASGISRSLTDNPRSRSRGTPHEQLEFFTQARNGPAGTAPIWPNQRHSSDIPVSRTRPLIAQSGRCGSNMNCHLSKYIILTCIAMYPASNGKACMRFHLHAIGINIAHDKDCEITGDVHGMTTEASIPAKHVTSSIELDASPRTFSA